MSTVLVVGFLKPTEDLGVDLFGSRQADLELHRLVDLGWPQAPPWSGSLQSKSQIHAGFRGRLDPCESPARGDERDIGLASLDDDFAEPGCGVDNGAEDRPELGPIGIRPSTSSSAEARRKSG
jgi:hypothetical protein